MEDKQLNFEQPLLSVRRCGSALVSQKRETRKIYNSHLPRLPPHRAELKSGPITNPGSVPFLWEQTPGQPKQGSIAQAQSVAVLSVGPKLPPGRYREAKKQGHDNISSITRGNGNTAVNVSSINGNKGEAVRVPYDENLNTVENGREMIVEKSSDFVDSDEEYVDAVDTLSRTESFFLNCNMSELDGLDAKPSGSFSMDQQNRELMMDRFLHAAKAMAVEAPRHVHKKQPAPEEKRPQVKDIANQCKPSLCYGPSFTERYSHYHDNEEEEEGEEDSDDDNDQRQNLPAACGLLPLFCLKSSLCHAIPVPALSMRTRVPLSSSQKVQPSSSFAGSCSETDNESMYDENKVKSIVKVQTAELDEGKTKARRERDRLENHSTPAYCGAPSTIHSEKRVPSIPEEAGMQGFRLHGKGSKTFQELLAEQDSLDKTDAGGSVVEKILYVDTVQKVGSTNLRPSSPDKQNMCDKKYTLISRKDSQDIIDKRIDQTEKMHVSIRDLKMDEVDVEEKSNDTRKMEMPSAVWLNQDFKNLNPSTTKNVEWPPEKKGTKVLDTQLPRATTLKQSHQIHYQILSPPLPQSPSDSWLCRTLPSKSTKRTTLRSYLAAAKDSQNQGSKALTDDNKWETFVRTT